MCCPLLIKFQMTDSISTDVVTIEVAPSFSKETSKRYVIIFHNDADGWGACGIALNALTDPSRRYVTKAVNYPDDFSTLVDELEPDDHVYVLDFSFKRDICDAIYAKVEKFVVLDHHETARKELEGTPYAVFDITKSGVLLTYEHFFPEMISEDYETIPVPVRLLDNYDLWKKDDKNVGWKWAVGFHLFVIDHYGDFTFWRELMGMIDLPLATYNIVRQKILDFEVAIDEIMKSAEFSQETFEGKNFIVLPSIKHISLVADAIRDSDNYTADFVASFYQDDERVTVSLRGSDSFKVRELAEKLGGGGHDLAAGFSFVCNKDSDLKGEVMKKLQQGLKLL